MDISVINPFFFPYQGGTEKVLHCVYSRLAKRHNITVITGTLANSKKTVVEYIDGIKVIRVKTKYIDAPKLPLPFMRMYGVNSHIKNEGSDVYHINNRFLYYGGTIKAIKGQGKKMVLTLHNSKPQNIDLATDIVGTMYDVAWGRKIMEEADAITGVSRDTIDTTVPQKLLGKARVIYNGVDFDIFKYRRKSDPKVRSIINSLGLPPKIILNNARLVPQKGHIYLLKAFAKLSERYRDEIGMVMIGRGPLEWKIREKADRLGVTNFKMLSGIPEIDLPYYYNASDAFVFPSLYEPAGGALLEALAAEVPTIATRIGGIPEYMKDNGYYVNDRDAKGIVDSIERMFSEPKRARSLARRARGVMIKEHNWDKIARQYENVFQELVRY